MSVQSMFRLRCGQWLLATGLLLLLSGCGDADVPPTTLERVKEDGVLRVIDALGGTLQLTGLTSSAHETQAESNNYGT